MENNVITNNQVDNAKIYQDAISKLVAARHGLVKAAKGTGEVINTYANALCSTFNILDTNGELMTPWFELKGKARIGVKTERDSFKAEMITAGFNQGTIDVYWQRVKEASGYVTSGNRVKSASTTDEKTLTELKTIINRIFKAEENGEDCKSSDVKSQLIEAYEILGGDVDNLG
jgi:hypothetical protein